MGRTGIYRIANTVTNRSYVGSSTDIAKRWDTHRHLLRFGKSHSPKLQNAWNKYGADVFTFEVLEDCAASVLEEREAHWVSKLCSVAQGYNCSADVKVPTRGYKHSDTARLHMAIAQKNRNWNDADRLRAASHLRAYNESLRGVAQTEEHRKKIGEAHKGKKLSAAHIAKMRGRVVSNETRLKLSIPVVQYTSDGQFIARFVGAVEATRATGISRTSLNNCLKGRSKSSGGFVWKYV